MDGDMVILALPADYAGEVFKDPLAINAIKSGQPMGAAGRYTAQRTLNIFYHHVPQWLQAIVSPIDSIYLATGLFYLLCHVLFIYFMARLITGIKNPINKNNLIIYAITSPLLAFYGYQEVQGLIDHAPTYTFYYIWPTLIILFIFLPMIRILLYPDAKGFNFIGFLCALIVGIFISQGGPLAPVVIIMWGGIILLALIYNIKFLNNFQSVTDRRSKFIYPVTILIVMLICSLYANYISKYNPEFITNDALVPLAQRFGLLFKGLAWILTKRLGFSLLLISTSINFIILNKIAIGYWKQFKFFISALLLFSIIYIMLLPFGGYREYRPLIIRYDTLIPVTICLFVAFIHSSWYLLNNLQGVNRKIYTGFITLIIGINAIADVGIKRSEQCEKETLQLIAASSADTIWINNQCNIIAWRPLTNPYDANLISKMLQVWNITDRDKLFLQKVNK